MSQNIIDDDRQAAEAEEPPRRTRAFFIALWLLGCVGVGLAVIQFTRERTTSLQISDCAAMHEDASRLRCYDAIARRPPPEPARGSPLP